MKDRAPTGATALPTHPQAGSSMEVASTKGSSLSGGGERCKRSETSRPSGVPAPSWSVLSSQPGKKQKIVPNLGPDDGLAVSPHSSLSSMAALAMAACRRSNCWSRSGGSSTSGLHRATGWGVGAGCRKGWCCRCSVALGSYVIKVWARSRAIRPWKQAADMADASKL